MSSLFSILQDPTLPWDKRCAGIFTIFGHQGHHLSIHGIQKRDEKIIELYQSCGLSVKEYLSINAELQKLYENPPLSFEEQAAYLLKIQGLRSRLPGAIQGVQLNMMLLSNALTSTEREEYYKKLTEGWSLRVDKSVAKEIKESQKQLYNAALHGSSLMCAEMQRYSPSIPKELYARLVTADWSEWTSLLDKIYDPKTTDADRQETFAQLKIRKDFLSSALSQVLSRTDAQTETIHDSWGEAPDVLNRDFNRAKFYTDPRDVNLSELSVLAESDPQLYRERSLLYQQKLINLGQHSDAVVHATQWMSSLPQDASWEDAVQMASLYMQAHQDIPDSTEFLNALNRWAKDQSNLHADPNGYLPFRREAEQIAIARGALYANSDQKLSTEAVECYEMWKMISPNDPVPKVRLAQFYIANAEWDKSKEAIAELPEEYSVWLNEDRLIHMFNVYSLPVEAADLLISKFIVPFARRKILPGSNGDIGLDVLNATVQCASHQVFRRFWMPRLVEDLCPISQEPLSFMDKASLGILTAQVVLPFVLPKTFEFFVPNLETRTTYLQPVIEFCSPSLGIVGSGIFVHGAYAAGKSLVMPVTVLTSSTVSLISKAVLRYNKKMSSTHRGMLMTATNVLTNAQYVGMVCASRAAISSVASHVVLRSGVQVLCSSARNLLSGLPAAGVVPSLGTALTAATIAYGIFVDFPMARTSAALEEASRRCQGKEYSEAQNILKTAEEWFWLWSDRAIIQKYADCVPFLERASEVGSGEDHRQWIRDTIPKLDETIKMLQKSSYYSTAKEDLQYHKVVAYLSAEQMDDAKVFLASIDNGSVVHARIVLFVIQKAKNVDDYLVRVRGIFQIPEYSEIITKYQEYIACQKRYPIASEDGRDVSVVERDQIIASLLQLVQPRKILGPLEESLLFDALFLHVNTGNSEKTTDLLTRTTSEIHERLAVNLIRQAIEFSTKNDIDKALCCLDRGIALHQFIHQPLLKAFRAYIELQRIQLTKESSSDEIHQRLTALDVIAQNAGKVEISSFVQERKLSLYLQTEKFQEAATWVTQQSIAIDVQDSTILQIIHIAENSSGKNLDPDALAYLRKAYDAFAGFTNRFVIERYRDLVACKRQKFASDEGSAQWTALAQAFIEEVKPIQRFSSLLSWLEREMAIMHAHKKEYAQAMEIIRRNACSDIVKADMVMHILNQALVLPTEETRAYLQNAYNALEGFEHRDILQAIQRCLPNDLERFTLTPSAIAWAEAADALIAQIKPIEGLAPLHLQMKGHRFLLHIHLKEYVLASAMIKEIDFSEEFHGDAVKLIISNANELAKQDEISRALNDLQQAYDSLAPLAYREILIRYRDTLACSKDRSSSVEMEDRWLAAQSALIEVVRPIKTLASFYSHLENTVALMYVRKKKYGLLRLNNCSPTISAEIVLQIIHQADQFSPHEARVYLEDAYKNLGGFKYRDILQLYRDCLSNGGREISPEEGPGWLSAADRLIATVKPIQELSILYTMMQASKCMFHVFKKEYLEATTTLRTGVLTREFQLKPLRYILDQACGLSQQDRDQEALIYLKEAYKGMSELAHRNILLKFKDYLTYKKDSLSTQSVANWVTASEALLADLKPIPQMMDLTVTIRYRQFCVFLEQKKFHDLKHVLEQPEISPDLRAKLQEQLIGHLLQYQPKANEFEKITNLFDISRHKLARQYRAVCISLEQHQPIPTSMPKVQESIHLLEALSDSLSTLEIRLPNWVITVKANLYCAAGQFYQEAGHFGSSLGAFSSAETLLVKQGLSANQEKLARIRRSKEKISALIRETQESSYV